MDKQLEVILARITYYYTYRSITQSSPTAVIYHRYRRYDILTEFQTYHNTIKEPNSNLNHSDSTADKLNNNSQVIPTMTSIFISATQLQLQQNSKLFSSCVYINIYINKNICVLVFTTCTNIIFLISNNIIR